METDQNDSDTETEQHTYTDPLAEVDGMEQVEIKCMDGIRFKDSDEHCDGWSTTFELDDPAIYNTETEKIQLSGFDWECPECGQPHNFEVEGIPVSNLM